MTGEGRNPGDDLRLLTARQHDVLEKLIRWYFPPSAQGRAIWVAWQLSAMNATDLSASGQNLWGLFHIDPEAVALPRNEGWRLLDPIRNVAAAFKLWERFGWSVFGLDVVDPPKAFDEEEKGG